MVFGPKNKLVAIVDDDPHVSTGVRRLLRSEGFDVETFPSGEEFLRALQCKRPDCLLLDLHMPQLNGFEVLRELVRMRACFPVIVVTGGDEPGVEKKSLAAGAAAFLLKPLEEGELLTAVRTALQS